MYDPQGDSHVKRSGLGVIHLPLVGSELNGFLCCFCLLWLAFMADFCFWILKWKCSINVFAGLFVEHRKSGSCGHYDRIHWKIQGLWYSVVWHSWGCRSCNKYPFNLQMWLVMLPQKISIPLQMKGLLVWTLHPHPSGCGGVLQKSILSKLHTFLRKCWLLKVPPPLPVPTLTRNYQWPSLAWV